MSPKMNVAGAAGILAGIGLAVESTLFMSSGWTPGMFGDPFAAIAFLQEQGAHLRAAVFAGALNLVFMTVFIAGIAAMLRPSAPSRASATLYFGLIGIAAHGLVPLGLWLGVPLFVDLAGSDPDLAASAWAGFHAFLEAAGGVGQLFAGASLLAAGWAVAAKRVLPASLGWVGIVAGTASVFGVLATATPLAGLATVVYLPGLLLLVVFRVWGGSALRRKDEPSASRAEHPGRISNAST